MPISVEIKLESSKSESNRSLIINALASGQSSNIENVSNARDTRTMVKLLTERGDFFDVKDAGTTMRFLTAFLALKGTNATITGTDRMKQRPIGPLVDSLRDIGAKISYKENEGYPPLIIDKMENQVISELNLPGNISSQYISALLMIAPCLPQGLIINLTTEIYSRPYIQMTLDLMSAFGVNSLWEGQRIEVKSQNYMSTSYVIEGDWSGASYWYTLIALSESDSLKLLTVRDNSTQGDRQIAAIMEKLGVASSFDSEGVSLSKKQIADSNLKLDFKNCPDLAQTVMVAAAASGVRLEMTGLESLKIKETDRIAAMQNELKKIGASLEEESVTWILHPSKQLPDSLTVETYEDHRMAMAFAPLSQLMDVEIDDPGVVEKSYPAFWEEMKKLGVVIQ